jgi:hypothetical protein
LFINSDDGSKLVLDDRDIILNDGIHPRGVEKFEYYALAKGFHKLHLEYFQETGKRFSLRLSVVEPGKQRIEVPEEWLYH